MITVEQLVEFTHVEYEDDEEANDQITEAQSEFEREVSRTFDGTEGDYKSAQRATAFLTAYFIHYKRKEFELSDQAIKEYRRLLKILKIVNDPANRIYFQPKMGIVSDDSDSSRYSSDSTV